ncbi:MAG: class I SAM-dependent methyltransferase [Candidatus Bathyarchaeota archaeon]|nr:class I SAM-dependent methyltransferase [Candidatus Bathyarchaeota archaeon]
MNVFDAMGIYWAEIADKNKPEQQIQFLKATLKTSGYVLDLACGTGRHAIPLTKDGYCVVGLDISRTLLSIAKKRYSQIQLVRGDMRFLPFTHEAFTAAISMDTSFGYLPTEQDGSQSLSELRQALNPRGVLIVDVFNREQLISKYSRKPRFKWALLPFLLKLPNRWLLCRFFKWREYPSFWLLQKRTVSKGGECLSDLWVIYDKATSQLVIYEHSVRLYTLNQLQDLLAKSGFMVQQLYGGYKREAFGADSSRLILLATAK